MKWTLTDPSSDPSIRCIEVAQAVLEIIQHHPKPVQDCIWNLLLLAHEKRE